MKSSLRVLIGLIAFTFATPSFAGLILVLDDLSTAGIDVIVTDDVDGGVGTGTDMGASTSVDIAAGDGFLLFNGSVGSFIISVTTGLSKPTLPGDNQMHLTSVNMSGGAGGTIRVLLTDTDFLDATGGLTFDIGGVTGGTVMGKGALGSNNAEFGADFSVALGPLGSGAFSDTGHVGVPNVDLDSLTLDVLISHESPFDVTSFDAEVTVPEPPLVALFGLGLLGLFMARKAGRRTVRG